MTFNPILPLWLLSTLLIGLTVAFVWMEYSRPLKYTYLRITAVCLMMLSVAGLFLRPEYQSTKDSNTVLLTEQYSSGVVDSLLRKNPSLTLVNARGVAPYKKSKGLNSYQQLGDPSMKVKAVIGDGVPDYALESLSTSFEYYPSENSSGVNSLYLSSDIQRNNEYHIQGSFFNARDTVKLFLEHGGTKIDSVQLASGLHHFDLRFTPRADGNTLYHLRSANDSVARPIPVHVNSGHPLNILVLQGYPTFEIQYLKNFLAGKRHRLALRYQLSKGIFRYEFANRKSVPISRINEASLTEFDLLISDAETLTRLSAPERGAVMNAIKHGLGFLAIFPETPKRIHQEFLPFDFKKISHDTTVLKVGTSTYALPAVPVRPLGSSSMTTVTSNRTGTLNGYTYQGRGRIGYQLLQETYRLILSGDSVNYGRLWSPLVNDIARTDDKKSELRLEDDKPVYTDEPFNISVISSVSAPAVFADSIRVPLIEDEAIDDVWHAKLWAGQPGWHQLSANGDTTQYYVFKDGDWRDLRAASTIESNRIASRVGASAKADMSNTPYAPIYFFLLFVISAGCVWLAPKL